MTSVGVVSGIPYGPSLPATGRSPSADAELQKYQKQLCDMITCPSRKTAEGKAKIKDIESKIGALKTQMTRADAQGSAPSLHRSADLASGSAGRTARLDGLGGRLDVWA